MLLWRYGGCSCEIYIFAVGQRNNFVASNDPEEIVMIMTAVIDGISDSLCDLLVIFVGCRLCDAYIPARTSHIEATEKFWVTCESHDAALR